MLIYVVKHEDNEGHCRTRITDIYVTEVWQEAIDAWKNCIKDEFNHCYICVWISGKYVFTLNGE